MLQFLHKILAFILALVILFSTLSFTVEKHICLGEVIDVSYFSKADNCGMVSEDCDLDIPSQTKIQREKCCNDTHELVQGNQHEQPALKKIEINQVAFIFALVYSYNGLFEQKTDKNYFSLYLPPLVHRDLPILYQTFLI